MGYGCCNWQLNTLHQHTHPADQFLNATKRLLSPALLPVQGAGRLEARSFMRQQADQSGCQVRDQPLWSRRDKNGFSSRQLRVSPLFHRPSEPHLVTRRKTRHSTLPPRARSATCNCTFTQLNPLTTRAKARQASGQAVSYPASRSTTPGFDSCLQDSRCMA